jgi:hypothetical protein
VCLCVCVCEFVCGCVCGYVYIFIAVCVCVLVYVNMYKYTQRPDAGLVLAGDLNSPPWLVGAGEREGQTERECVY